MADGLCIEELNNLFCTCGQPVCEDKVVFHSGCHITEPTWCEYYDGLLVIVCAECNEEIIRISVARLIEKLEKIQYSIGYGLNLEDKKLLLKWLKNVIKEESGS